MPITLFNPLPVTLSHYAKAMDQTLARIGVETRSSSPDPPADAHDKSHARRLMAHLNAIRAARASNSPTLVLWPALGWLEPGLWPTACRTTIVIHDPVPLRRQYGQGGLGRLLGKVVAGISSPCLVCHTQEAADATAGQLGLGDPPPVRLHPILSDRERGRDGHGSGTVLVAGQYKPVRDLELLSTLGPLLRSKGYRPRLVGQGWPRIEGWASRNEFVTEEELEAEMGAAEVVLLPYRRYWQSGISVRALEEGVPVVGARTEFLQDLMGEDYPGFVFSPSEPRHWLDAVERAGQAGDLDRRYENYRRSTDQSWAPLAGELGAIP